MVLSMADGVLPQRRKGRVDCGEARSLFDLLMDRELVPSERDLLLRHLEACEGCRREYELLVRIEKTVGSMALEAAPARLTRSVMDEIAGARAVERLVGIAAGAAGIVTALLFGIDLARRGVMGAALERLGRVMGASWEGLRQAGSTLQERVGGLEGSHGGGGGDALLVSLIALAVAIFLTLQTVRLSKELAREWHNGSLVPPHGS